MPDRVTINGGRSHHSIFINPELSEDELDAVSKLTELFPEQGLLGKEKVPIRNFMPGETITDPEIRAEFA